MSRERAAASCSSYTGKFPEIPTISGQDVKKMIDEGKRICLVDVRCADETRVSMINGAITVEEFENSENYSVEACADAIIVPYCTIGYRSGVYARKLREKGYKDVRNGEGVVMWTHDVGSDLVDSEGNEVKRLHVYGKRWDLASQEYSTVTFGAENWISCQVNKLKRLFSK